MRGLLVSVVVFVTISCTAFFLWRRYTRRVSQIPAYLDSYWDMLKERRRTIRLKKELPVTCNVEEKPGSLHHIFSKDISGEGICIRVPEILAEGSPLELIVEMPEDGPISVRGEVVWVKESQIEDDAQRLFDTGIKFTKVEPKEEKRLKDFLHSALNIEAEQPWREGDRDR